MEPDQPSASQLLYRRALRVMPGGNARVTVFFPPHPIYARSGQGCRVVDVDGVERIDFINNYTALIHGHAHPEIVRAAADQIRRGTAFSLPTEAEVELAELLCARGPTFDRVRFVNSGTEAVMTAIKAARAYTGRHRIARCEGAYHGSYDYVEVSLAPTPGEWGEPDPSPVAYAPGTPPSVLEDVVVIPFNDAEAARRILRREGPSLAAVIVDPLPNRAGLVPADPGFLQTLRDVTREVGALLIFDEVIAFRLDFGGAQALFGVEADLTALGKIIGGGFPVGAVAGRAGVMAVFDPSAGPPRLAQGGTFSANPITMAAGAAALRLLTREEIDRLNALGDEARRRLNAVFREKGVAGQVTGMGSLLKIHFKDGPIRDYRTAYPDAAARRRLATLHRRLLDRGVLISPTGLMALSTPMGEAEVQHLVQALRDSLDQ